ncbi:HAD-IIA family hydrolase [Amycolatopsis magusensis]|uniref:HAD-IIA family hydrolase n=1 Tax=Amycolatopsis magusensis TaxID=882444 RepID=UPI0024A904CD|nr:HAD-IIA family hydrolase [Amycolatopsis magusensis]MDI5982192.1 HAD-IIA family hydrolase [Amycolatopsis magusensis]
MSDALLAAYDSLLFDLDGTVYHGARVIPGAPEVIGEARAAGTAVRFVTNNASKAPAAVAEHLNGMGIDAQPDEVHTSSQAAARVLAERLPAGAHVLVVGAQALCDEVEAVGLRPVRENSDEVKAVVQGHSPDTGWANLAEACIAIRGGALWVASNVDKTLPAERGLLPGNGSMVAALRTATDQEPVVAGKPEAPLMHTAAQGKALVVGDRLDTDIAGAVAAGLDALVVLTGVDTPASLIAAVPAERARFLTADITGLRSSAEETLIAPKPGWEIAAEQGELAVRSTGGSDATDLVRALCATAWETGVTGVKPLDDTAEAALNELGLIR